MKLLQMLTSRRRFAAALSFCLLVYCNLFVRAFSHPAPRARNYHLPIDHLPARFGDVSFTTNPSIRIVGIKLRGGGEQSIRGGTHEGETVAESSKNNRSLAVTTASIMASFTALGRFYAKSLDMYPILTKSLTAGCIFALSDYCAQRLECQQAKSPKTCKLNWTRILTAGAVGLFYFGPAAHYWYDMIFRLLPGTSLVSTLQKATLGQLLFGPSFTCIFFATSLLQAGTFSIGNWLRKIKNDLPSAWLAGIGFWPLVDLVSYSIISKEYIPLFVNVCSFLWTIFLSIVANR